MSSSCDGCEAHLYTRELESRCRCVPTVATIFVSGARAAMLDDGKFEELDAEVISIDPLEFVDAKPSPND